MSTTYIDSVASSGYITSNATDWHVVTQAGTAGTISIVPDNKSYSSSPSSKKVYHPQLYFKYVKSKLTKLQQDKLKERLDKLKKLIVQAKELKQQALFEELAKRLTLVIKESEAIACGIEYRVERQHIDKIRDKVKGLNIEFGPFEEFPRTVPAKVVKKIKQIQKTCVFDSYWILYTAQLGEEKSKTNLEKIKEKDPILFGRFEFQPNTFYFIIDWIDEFCDLTLDKFLDTIKKDDPDYELDKIPDMNDRLIKQLIVDVKEKDGRLRSAKRDTYHGLMAEEAKKEKKMSKLIGKLKRKKK